MALNKTFKALADPTRREILRMLGDKALTAGEIAQAFAMTKPSVSHHLKALKEADLVQAERDGQHIIYSLNSSVVQEVVQEMLDFFKFGEQEKEERHEQDD